jgi:hypothetical protein
VLRSSQLDRELTDARHHAVAEDVPCNMMTSASEVACRNALRAILQHAESCHGSGGSSVEAAVQRIEALASRALERRDQFAGDTIPAGMAAVAAAAPVPA